jgi:hypothetical protein
MHAAASCASVTMEEATPRESDDTADDECMSVAADLPQDILAKVRIDVFQHAAGRERENGGVVGRVNTNGVGCERVGAVRCCFC